MKVKLLFPLLALLFSISTFSQVLNQPNDMFVCDGSSNDGIADFDLDSQTSQILGGLDPNDYIITYHETEADAFNQLNPLISPYSNISNPQTIHVSAIDNGGNLIDILTFDLIVNSLPINGFAQDVLACDEGGGFAAFNLSQFDAEFAGSNPSFIVSYYETLQDADSNINQITNPDFYYNTVPYFQTIYVRIDDANSGCYYVSGNTVLYLNVTQEIVINVPTPLVVCDDDDDGISIFSLEDKTPEILGGNQNPTLIVSYHETQADADNSTNALSSPYTNTIVFGQIVFVRVTDINGDCFQTTTLELVVDINCLFINPSVTLESCTDGPNLETTFDLTVANTLIVNNQNTADFSFTYHLSQADADNQVNPIPNPNAYISFNPTELVYVYVEELATGNSAIATIYLIPNISPQIDFNGPYTICSGNEIVLYPFINNDIGVFDYLWSTGETDPEIVVNVGGVYTVTVTDLNTGCVSSASVEVIEGGNAPALGDAADLSSCEPNATFDLTTTLPEILNGLDPSIFIVSFFNDANSAYTNTNPITNEANYTPFNATETIYVRVQNISDDCFEISDFTVTSDNSCPVIVDCAEPITNTFCYTNGPIEMYRYESADSSQLQAFFIEGQVEVNYDELVVYDSDGFTNLNPTTIYGDNGNLAGLNFISTGNSITVFVDSDGSVSCADQNYTPIVYEVSCADPNALPGCNATLTQPLDGAVDVDETTVITWTASSGIVTGYKLSLGLTSGGTEVLDHVDVGNVLTYDAGILDYEVTYYLTITPYNTNGDAEECTENSFTTRANPNQIVVCNEGVVNTTYCYDNNDTSEFNFQSSDGLPLTLYFNTGGTEVTFDEVSIIDSDGSILNPNLPFGNDGNFAGLTYTSTGSSITVQFDSDGSVSCANGNACCTEQFDFDVYCTGSIGIIEVNAFVDDNVNNVFDANEFNFSNGYFTYEVNGDGNINTVNSSTGSFQIISGNDSDVYEITFNLYDESAGCYDITTASFNNISVPEGSTVAVDFAVVEEQSCEDLAVYLINYWTPPRPGFSHENYLVLENLGFTTISSGTVEFTHDPLLVYNGVTSVNPNYTITNTGTGFTVDFVNLQPGDVEYIDISLTCPVVVEIGDILTNSAIYVTDTNDLVPGNNYSTLSELVVGSWDPNDKMESHGPKVLYDQFVISDEWLYYTVRFQNLGTAEAIFIRIEDELDASLDETTFQMLRSSHDNVVTRNENYLEWFFEDVNLPAEQDDADGSNGYVYFRIKPKAGYALGDVIPNTAAIYFDFNAPVITNRFETEFVDDALSVSEFDFNGFNMYPNPAKDVLNIKLNNITKANLSIYDIQGKLVLEHSISEEQNFELNVSDLQSGMYFVKLNTETRSIVKKLIIE
ncbi:T9SS type A sorting domain-containing protein [Psychroserpens jangbogonensis]|uniref:T9SS type A sorting domain-containing protein n=1 Tax=Psychroserpens jangbogonensis TaxID=1484460 RepID=UPI00053E7A4A|nr:T9SS type A sorting domain-containing protein [Psychroserpens jangbogonensis]